MHTYFEKKDILRWAGAWDPNDYGQSILGCVFSLNRYFQIMSDSDQSSSRLILVLCKG